VHYSFAYDVHIRGHKQSPSIRHITSSGIKTPFPVKLLDTFDRLNRWLYVSWPPINVFTKRRDMEVTPRQPISRSLGERLVNKSRVGYMHLDAQGSPVEIKQLVADDQDVYFERGDEQLERGQNTKQQHQSSSSSTFNNCLRRRASFPPNA